MSQAPGAIYLLLLAAGQGRRFGGDKLLAPFRGTPLIGHVAATLAQALHGGLAAGGVAIVAPQATALVWPLDTAGLEVAENADAASGIASSLRTGLDLLSRPGRVPEPAAALVVLADQPLLRLRVIADLVAAWRARPETCRPRYAEEPDVPGHPVLLARRDWSLASSLQGDEGLNRLLAGASVQLIDVPGANRDIDTPDDLRLLEDSC